MQKAMKTIASKMKKLDFCLMITTDGRGTHHARPMSNNKNVDYDGTAYFFSNEDTNKVRQIMTDQNVSLEYQSDDMVFIHAYGEASIIKQRGRMEPYWEDSLNQWFPQGLDTPGLVMIRHDAKKIQYWDKGGEGIWQAD